MNKCACFLLAILCSAPTLNSMDAKRPYQFPYKKAATANFDRRVYVVGQTYDLERAMEIGKPSLKSRIAQWLLQHPRATTLFSAVTLAGVGAGTGYALSKSTAAKNILSRKQIMVGTTLLGALAGPACVPSLKNAIKRRPYLMPHDPEWIDSLCQSAFRDWRHYMLDRLPTDSSEYTKIKSMESYTQLTRDQLSKTANVAFVLNERGYARCETKDYAELISVLDHKRIRLPRCYDASEIEKKRKIALQVSDWYNHDDSKKIEIYQLQEEARKTILELEWLLRIAKLDETEIPNHLQ